MSYLDNSLTGSFLDDDITADTERRAGSDGLTNSGQRVSQIRVLVFLSILKKSYYIIIKKKKKI